MQNKKFPLLPFQICILFLLIANAVFGEEHATSKPINDADKLSPSLEKTKSMWMQKAVKTPLPDEDDDDEFLFDEDDTYVDESGENWTKSEEKFYNGTKGRLRDNADAFHRWMQMRDSRSNSRQESVVEEKVERKKPEETTTGGE